MNNHAIAPCIQSDVIVVGGGVVGLAVAASLSQQQLRVSLVEAGSIIPFDEGYTTGTGIDAQVSAISLRSENFLKHLGAWQNMPHDRMAAYQHMHVWDADGTGALHFSHQNIASNHLGHIIELKVLKRALLHCALSTRKFRCIQAKVKAYSRAWCHQHQAERSYVELTDGRVLSASLVVAADGRRSRLREWSGIPVRAWDYHQHAIITTVRSEKAHQATAWQRFLPTGPLALLPLSSQGDQNYTSLVWSTTPEEAARLMALQEGEFLAELARASEYCLGHILGVDKRYSIPLRQSHALNYVKPGLVLVGDAAHSIHPLAGQGLNLGLMDVQALSEVLQQAAIKSGGRRTYGMTVLKRYERMRQHENLKLMLLVESLKHLFGTENLAIRTVRSAGLSWVNQRGWLKRLLVSQAV